MFSFIFGHNLYCINKHVRIANIITISLVEGLPPRLIMPVYYMLYPIAADFMDNSRELFIACSVCVCVDYFHNIFMRHDEDIILYDFSLAGKHIVSEHVITII